MNKLLIAALISISYSGAMAQEATYEYPSPIVAGASRAAVQSELARAKLDGSYFAGGEQSTAGDRFTSTLSRAEVVAELDQARADGRLFTGGDASYDPRSNGTAGASRVAAGATTMRVEIVAASERTRTDAFPGGEATPDMPQPIHSEVSRADVVAALERSHADGSYWGGGETSPGSGEGFHATLTRAEVRAALAQSHADGTYWGGGEISAMSGPGPVEAARAGRALPQVAMN